MSKSRVSLTGSQISEKWNKNTKAAVPYIQQGIDNLQDNPLEKAADNVAGYLAGVTEAANNGRWANGLRSVPFQQWKEITKKKVASSLGTGVDAAMPKRKAFDTYLVETLNGGLPTIAAMPNNTIDESIAKMSAMARYMHEHPYK